MSNAHVIINFIVIGILFYLIYAIYQSVLSNNSSNNLWCLTYLKLKIDKTKKIVYNLNVKESNCYIRRLDIYEDGE